MQRRATFLGLIMVMVAAGAACSDEQPESPASAPQAIASGLPWTQQQLQDFVARFGFTEMPLEQRAATVDGMVTIAELEQAMGRVENCYEERQPGHDLGFSKEHPDPESGQPEAFTIRIATTASDSGEGEMDAVLAECEGMFSHPLDVVFNEMHKDHVKFEAWLARQTPGPDAETWSVEQDGTPARADPGE